MRFHRHLEVGIQGTRRLALATVKAPYNDCPYAILVPTERSGMYAANIDPTNGRQFFTGTEFEPLILGMFEDFENECEQNRPDLNCVIEAQTRLNEEVGVLGHGQIINSAVEHRTLLLLRNEILDLKG